jgi:polar amino acid transport system substrate-binding protein
MKLQTRAGVLIAALFLITACGGPGAESPAARSPAGESPAAGSPAGESPAAGSPAGESPAAESPAGGNGEGLLAEVRQRGVIRISTDADYAPQSSVTESGGYEGFDIDVGEEIARRLGVTAEWTAQNWDNVVAGNWSNRWDMSVGSMTITPERDEELFEFTQPYYYTPVVVSVPEGSGIASLEELAGRVACVGEDTTYLYWIDGTLNLGEGGEILAQPPEGLTATTLPTDADCATSVRSGRTDFDAFISAKPTVEEAIAADTPIEIIGDPIFYEPLGIAFDQNGADVTALTAEVDRIVGEMHADGTLTELSMKWYEEDLTQTE